MNPHGRKSILLKDLDIDKGFPNRTLLTQKIVPATDKQDLIKLKSICAVSNTHQRAQEKYQAVV